jgi:acetylcholinesterase
LWGCQSEGCLYSAIWTPTTPLSTADADGLPVLLAMTGGGYIIDGVDIPWQIRTSWAEHTHSHIVVSINLRLDIFGFLNTCELRSNGYATTS